MARLSLKNLAWVSIPTVVAVSLEPVSGLIDTILVGQLDTSWLASLALTNAVLLSLAWVFGFLNHGASAWVAEAYGGRNGKLVDVAVSTTILVATFLGVVLAIILLLGREFFLKEVMGAAPHLIATSKPYWFWRVAAYPLALINLALVAIMRGLNYFRPALWVLAVQTASNVIVTYLLLYVFPMGIAGAGIGTFLSFLAGSSLAVYFVFGVAKCRVRFDILAEHYGEIFRFGRDAGNHFGRTACLTAAFFLMTNAATRLGESILASHQVALQVWLMSSFIIDGLAVTATSFGSQLLGGRHRRAFTVVGLRLLFLALPLGSLVTLSLYWGQNLIVNIFSPDPAVAAQLANLWWLLAFSQVFNGFLYVLDGIVFGARSFEFLRKRMLEGFILLFLPTLAYGFYIERSLASIWWGLAFLNIYRLTTEGYWFWKLWKRVWRSPESLCLVDNHGQSGNA